MSSNDSQIKYLKTEDCIPMPELGRSYYDQTSYFYLKNTLEKEGWKPNYPASAIFNEKLGKWEVFVGVHRLKIAKELGIHEIPVVQSHVTREQAIADGIKSNMKQGPYNPIDIAYHMDALRKGLVFIRTDKNYERPTEYDVGFISRTYGWSQPTVYRYLSLLHLPVEVQEMVGKRIIGMRHALALLKLEDPLKMAAMAEECASKGWSLRETEKKVELALKNPDVVPQYKACTECGRGFQKEKITRITDELCPDCLLKRRERQHREYSFIPHGIKLLRETETQDESATAYMQRRTKEKEFGQKLREKLSARLMTNE